MGLVSDLSLRVQFWGGVVKTQEMVNGAERLNQEGEMIF